MRDDAFDSLEDARYRALLRRDWAVRVLDAWAGTPRGVGHHTFDDGLGGWCCVLTLATEANGRRKYEGGTPDAARLAAAQAVFPTLTAAVRAELGECP